MLIFLTVLTHLSPQKVFKVNKICTNPGKTCTQVPLNFENLTNALPGCFGHTLHHWPVEEFLFKEKETMQEGVHHLTDCLPTHHKGLKLRVSNS